MDAEFRSLCANCGHWREEHYTKTGNWMGDRIGCAEYFGTEPSEERRARKKKELAAAAKQHEPTYSDK